MSTRTPTRSRATFAVAWIVAATAAIASAGPPTPDAAEPRFPARLSDIDGRTIDVDTLARDRNLVVVTMKAPTCPVCRRQLARIRERLPELEACGVTFVVLAPGTPEQLAAAREETGFRFPFVVDPVSRSPGAWAWR